MPPGVRTRIVAVDGPGGAGKSSLADRLARELDAQVIHTDDFASWENPVDWWPALIELALEPLAAGRAARYTPTSWGGEERNPLVIDPTGIVILEGVTASRQAFRPYLSYSIWIETPREVRLQRGLERDGEHARPQWERWMEEEDRYIERERPAERADMVVPGDRDLWTRERSYDPPVVPEASLEPTEGGLAPSGEGWFVLNARDACWLQGDGVSASCELEGAEEFPQVGIFLRVLRPGEPIALYHWEADQEDFLVLSGEALLIVEGEERPLRQWDLFHCPAGTKHIIVGSGDAPCAVLAVGAREHQGSPGWGGYAVDEAAIRHGAGVERETSDPAQAYARLPKRSPGPYREGWLPAWPDE
jgi:uridine kinase/uncharacterized cupin superfamily protein